MRKRLMMAALLASGWLAGAAEEMPLSIAPAPQGYRAMVAMTFDDGLRSHYDIALPMLEKYGLKGTFFVTVKQIGGEGRLSWEQMLEMQKRGMEIGNHTMTHASLGRLLNAGLGKKELPTMTPEEQAKRKQENLTKITEEVVGAKRVFEEHGIEIRTIAFGGNNRPREVVRIARSGGMMPRMFEVGTSSKDTQAKYEKWFADFERPGACSVLMIHGVTRTSGGWNPIPSEGLFEFLVSGLAKRKGELFIDTFAKVMEYRERAQGARLVATEGGEYRLELGKGQEKVPGPGRLTIQVKPGLAVTVNGKPKMLTAENQFEAETGDTIKVEKK